MGQGEVLEFREHFSREEVEQGLQELLEKITGKKLGLDDNFEEKGVDEVDVADLIVESELKFNVRIADEKLFEFKNLREVADYVYNIVKE
jgi:acyl carrier protein